ncbi:2Fe-2S iron-sulfur cluster-binding protein [Cyanobacterium aponinum UTEX 3222]|uniref:Ferredoxin n=3 Tax=Cyanobacterium aponinum TaxID=379064 RepID=K9Z1G0_CYAAP|nr:2Fe-2S iron-sulfur cluster-binding protein [Cyanobacterium aponinum]WRL41017.1 2Fe-2S iron-sulfur cluster-binding protein [Cyanobacterium aponinum UTEX 3222]AFZ53046.1 ferredoxin [Cyanobacterium aponinum PCC 10605]MBD2393592.1 (2Fe-2S)-binding protein [Cyanobacterium aponinum FACHB-4101]MTF39439.1 2Fe-2S iron-sulfur cluster binding domain-containing protein [Cyanobacterium aponinum 0216]PHV61259.1 ferredoxin [Cyanobacterium aponinum IPPAS B-1201]
MLCKISFTNNEFPPLELPAHQSLADHLTAQNSPILFGCRTGLCGTCLVEIIGNIPPPKEEEKEVLQILAPENPRVRLACQLDLTQDITIKTYEV